MLLPALKGARDMAKKSACASNLKQLGLADQMYLNDFGFHAAFFAVPIGGGGFGYTTGYYLDDYAPDILDKNKQPPGIGAVNPKLGGYVSRYSCPSYVWNTAAANQANPQFTVGINTIAFGDKLITAYATPSQLQIDSWNRWLKSSRINKPSDVGMFGDTAGTPSFGDTSLRIWTALGVSIGSGIDYRHNILMHMI
jgi:hypothetical protein